MLVTTKTRVRTEVDLGKTRCHVVVDAYCNAVSLQGTDYDSVDNEFVIKFHPQHLAELEGVVAALKRFSAKPEKIQTEAA